MSERAVYSGILAMGNIRMPINVYKAQDNFGLSASEFHKDCTGRIRYSKRCELHPDDQTPIIESCVETEHGRKILDAEVRDMLFDRKASMTYVENYPLRSLAFYFDYFPAEVYRVGVSNNALSNSLYTLLETMKKYKVFLLVTIGIGGMKRYAILLPSGVLIALAYNEEIRERPYPFGTIDKTVKESLEDIFNLPRKHFPNLSLLEYKQRIMDWIMPPKPAKNPRSNPKKVTDGTKSAKRLSATAGR